MQPTHQGIPNRRSELMGIERRWRVGQDRFVQIKHEKIH